MTLERLEQLNALAKSGELSSVEVELLGSFEAIRRTIVRTLDRHPILVRDWDSDGIPYVRPCGCAYCENLRRASVGITE
jgi:hypothetical protein